MATFLFDKIIFGPVQSRRLGVSLGINLLPTNGKICTFDCLYCECGLNKQRGTGSGFPSASLVKQKLEKALLQMQQNGQLPDVITFAGNGEPTVHPDFLPIIEDTITLRNQYAPKARIAVLSNATMLHKPEVVEALKMVDDNIQKLDGGQLSTINILNRPAKPIDLERLIDQLQQFNGQVVIQTLFVRGEYKGETFDNTTDEELEDWLRCLQQIQPREVMIYTIARDTPIQDMTRISLKELHRIGDRVKEIGLKVQISG